MFFSPKDPEAKKTGLLTRIMQDVDKKMGRTPAEGEDVTPESRSDVKKTLIVLGAVTVAAGGAALVAFKFLSDVAKDVQDSTTDEDTDEDEENTEED
jgi:hypothetical protein